MKTQKEIYQELKPIYSENGRQAAECMMDANARQYGEWLIKNCIVARNGFRTGTSNWSVVITNEEAYHKYLNSLENEK